MATRIAVKPGFVVDALLEINNAEFAHWYELGTWWAMYGEEQGRGPYRDDYLISNIGDGIKSGWYNDLLSGWFPMAGFFIGMVHGGMYHPLTRELRSSEDLIILSDPDFTRGYHAGRRYHFFAGGDEERLTDARLVEYINSWALEYHEWREPEGCLRFAIGCRIGEMSGRLLPMS